jgi:hypothetical protein
MSLIVAAVNCGFEKDGRVGPQEHVEKLREED